jgi:hypothetical protein
MCVTLDGSFGLDIGFIDLLYTRLRTRTNYSAIANLHNSQITIAFTNPFPVCYLFNSCSLITASNSGNSSASVLKSSLNGCFLPTDSFLHSLPYRTDLVAPIVFLITPRHGPSRKLVSISTSIVAPGFIALGTCLPRRCLEMGLVYLLISRSLHSNISTRYNTLDTMLETTGRWFYRREIKQLIPRCVKYVGVGTMSKNILRVLQCRWIVRMQVL